MITEQLKELRRQEFDKIEKKLNEKLKPEDKLFNLHSSQDRIVLSHAMFWVMTQSIKGKIAKAKFFIMLRKYQEEMLDAYLTEDDYFPELLRYCTIMYESLPSFVKSLYDFSTDKAARKFSAISWVAAGYAGDMPEDLCYELLDDMDFVFNRVKCRKIELMLPQLNRMVEEELKTI